MFSARRRLFKLRGLALHHAQRLLVLALFCSRRHSRLRPLLGQHRVFEVDHSGRLFGHAPRGLDGDVQHVRRWPSLLFLPRRLPLALCRHLGRVFRHCCVSGGQSPSLMDCHRPSSTPLSVPLFTLPLSLPFQPLEIRGNNSLQKFGGKEMFPIELINAR